MNFIDAIEKKTNVDFTVNDAKSLASSTSKVLDFFSKSGSLRGEEEEALKYFIGAYSEDKELALKALFYARDVRGGQGERELTRVILHYLGKHYANDIHHLVGLVSEYGRWDDLYAFIGTDLEDVAFEVMKEQFIKDLQNLREGREVSLLAKWLKSVNTSSRASRVLGRYTANKFNLNEPKYRKALSKLRKKIDIVERKISANQWDRIVYKTVPSQAMYKYKDAFLKNDYQRYTDFIARVKEGKETINAGTLYPYQIVKKVDRPSFLISKEEVDTYDEMWKALPNYMEEGERAIAVVDTSGSMTMGNNPNVRPIDISLSLGIYFAERNVGPFKDAFITFSSNPTLQKIKGHNIAEKVFNLNQAHWEMNTNLTLVFDTILDTAEDNNLSQEDIPSKIYIISDMQFDRAVSDNSKTNFEEIDEMFRIRGYERPDLVFWNVNAYSDMPVEKDETGTFLVSGASPSILKYAMNCESVTPYQLMLETLGSERYAPIQL